MSLIRGSLLPALIVGAVCIVVAGIAAGAKGVTGAAIGVVIVGLFFASSPLALGPVTKVSPHLSVMVALTFFFTKVIALVALMVVVLDAKGIGKHLDEQSLGITVIVSTLAWTFAMVRASTRSRLPMYDLNAKD